MLLILLSSAAFAPAPPSPVMQCLEKACPSQIAACEADATCEKGIQCVLAWAAAAAAGGRGLPAGRRGESGAPHDGARRARPRAEVSVRTSERR